jgi:thymidylate synthase
MKENNILSGLQFKATTATKLWEEVFVALMNQATKGFRQPSRVSPVVGEIINAHLELTDPRANIVNGIRNMSMKYAIGELLWYLSGTNSLKTIIPYAKFWESISDNGVSVNSAYGDRIHNKFGFDQWDYVKGALRKDTLSRQAVIHIKDADDNVTKDVPCTVMLQYLIRNDKLYATTYMRSNDVWLGLPYDMFTFTCLQVKMAMELDIDVGSYTHIAGSLHLYEKDVPETHKGIVSADQVSTDNTAYVYGEG